MNTKDKMNTKDMTPDERAQRQIDLLQAQLDAQVNSPANLLAAGQIAAATGLYQGLRQAFRIIAIGVGVAAGLALAAMIL